MSDGLNRERPSWDEWGMLIATAVSTRGDCSRSKVGAVLMDETTHEIVAVGYNGTNPGAQGCLSGACSRAFDPNVVSGEGEYRDGGYVGCIAKHAEHNLFMWLVDKWSIEYIRRIAEGTVLYVTRAPCAGCRATWNRLGIKRWVYP